MKSAFSSKVLGKQHDRSRFPDLEEYKTKAVRKFSTPSAWRRRPWWSSPRKRQRSSTPPGTSRRQDGALVSTLNVYDILNAEKFIVLKDAVAQIEEVYA